MSNRLDDAWFDLVPQALVEFDEHGRLLRSNAAFATLMGKAVAPGALLGHESEALQKLTGWDAPLALLGLAPGAPPLSNLACVAQGTANQRYLRSEVHAHPRLAGQPERFLCVVHDTNPMAFVVQTPRPPDFTNTSGEPTGMMGFDQDQLLHELRTILESSPAGIAYLRDNILVRCNRRFERMLGLSPGTLTGQHLDALLDSDPRIRRVVDQSKVELLSTGQFESELEIVAPGYPTRWYALSVRRIGPRTDTLEVIAVLSDITRIRSQQAQLEALGRDRDLMFTMSGVGIAFVRDGLVHSANPALASLLGLDHQDMAGRPLASLYITDVDTSTLARTDDQILAQLSEQGHWQGERALRHPRGTPLWAEVNLRLVKPDHPEEGFIASFVNVDDRHRAEQNLTLQADRTRAILDSVFVGIVTLDSGGIAWMNRSARRMFGGDLPDFLGHPLSTVATPDIDHPFRLTGYLDDLLDGQSHTFECQVMGRDGRVFWVVGNAVVTLGEFNERQITYALMDIDRRREAEALTVEAQATLQRIIEMAPMTITLCDAKTLTVIQANQAASAFMKIEPARAPGLTPEQIHGADRGRQLRADMLRALDSAKPLQREYKFEQGSGMQTWDVSYLPLSHDGQTADQLLLVASDVSEQRAAEQARLEAAIAQREMLVKEVHHRIKNNLQGVAGLLQQIAARKPEVASAISEVVGQVQAIAQVYGLQVGAGGPLRLKNVIEAIAQSVQRTFNRTITLVVEGCNTSDWQLPEAESIPIALSLNELLTNAHKHGQAGESLTCSMLCSEQQVCIEIRNTGVLPEGFNVHRVPGGVSGLGLVRALLPRRSSKLSMTQEGEQVVTRIELNPPGVSLVLTPHIPGAPSGQQIALWPQ
ncbi:MAG: PAS domain-containing protein [Polaromonas sp.]|uniref:PAS domain-containing sensor histidine kinase n=1 Tax=Burkholderiales TaxID=80840 RepID=UPI002487EA6F|nr:MULTISPECIES: PAS domain-containing protein [Burkholderiales]MDI1258642.1 PAS domain-containing protein [Aquabacterium sp.]MDI1270980.1 PAS domain-containing protein [Polaromonas sp.]